MRCVLVPPGGAVWRCPSLRRLALTPMQAAVRPPKLQYQITTLPNGLRVILSEDHSTPIVHVSRVVSRRLEERAGRTHRVCAPLRAHDVQGLEERGARIAHVDHRGRRRPEQRLHHRGHTVFWQTLAGAVHAAGAVDGSGPHGHAASGRRGVQARARGGQGRAADAHREPAVRPALRDHLRQRVHRPIPTSTRRSAAWRTSRPRPSRTCAISTAPSTCPRTPRVTIVGDFDIGPGAADGHAVFRPRAQGGTAGAARHPDGSRRMTRGTPRRGRGGLAAAGRRRGVPHHLRRASRFLPAAHHVEDPVGRAERADSRASSSTTSGLR